MTNAPKIKYLVSACLAGCSTNLCGKSSRNAKIQRWLESGEAVAVCPEQIAGLSTPRPPTEIQGGDGADVLNGNARVRRIDGKGVTDAFLEAAERVVEIAEAIKPDIIILKENSPSCGVRRIYDGSFSGRRIDGDGVTTAALKNKGFHVVSEHDI